MTTQEIFLRYTSTQMGKHDIRSHLVWDAAKFYDTQVESGKKEKPPVVVTLASKDDYLAYKKS